MTTTTILHSAKNIIRTDRHPRRDILTTDGRYVRLSHNIGPDRWAGWLKTGESVEIILWDDNR
jgi:hypothetical protein